MSWLNAVVKASGNAVRAVSGGIAKGGAKLGHLSAKLPVIGKPLSAIISVQFGAFAVVDSVLAGGRIDKVVYKRLKTDIKNAKTIAPYAQATVSLVPGVGSGVAGMIGAASALADGKSIDAAIVSGVRGAVPGGPAGQALFDVSCAVMQGKKPTDAMLQAIPLPPEQKKLAIAGIQAAKDIANGKKVDEAIVNKGMSVLPEGIRKGAQIGMALSHARSLQDATSIGVKTAIPKLVSFAGKAIDADARFKAGLTLMPSKSKKGYLLGIGLLSHKVTPGAVKAARESLPKEEQYGFDTAVAARIGSVQRLHLRGTPAKQFVVMAAHGARKGSEQLRQGIRQTIAKTAPNLVKDFDMRAKPWWKRILIVLGVKKDNVVRVRIRQPKPVPAKA